MPRRLRYQVAATLDGFIAGPKGEYDWIVPDPAIDFAAMYKEFDTAVMGRGTYEVGVASGGDISMPGIEVFVFSQTLPPSTKHGFRIVNDDPAEIVADLKAKSGRDIWLFGGGKLFRYLLDAGLVDTVEIAVMPVMLGEGIPVLPAGAAKTLELSDVKQLPSGIVALAYRVKGSRAAPPKIKHVKPKPTKRKVASRVTKKRKAARAGRR
ncbi:MAG TPA: dihydrofolate reductase family protein [Gemmatimonadaceae bacterium]|nr:dihydrofolate reductase family protein [Gemmatimonadaceae bacterium]